jgi:soluble P-type ATPase
MISILRPGLESLEIDFILVDFDGTLASDGRIHPKAKDKLNLLAKRTTIYILAKGEKERVEEVLRKVKAEVVYVPEGEASPAKRDLLHRLGEGRSVAIGNGAEDASMIEGAGLGICILCKEGTAGSTLAKADLVFTSILDALDFLLKPLRQKGTLGE